MNLMVLYRFITIIRIKVEDGIFEARAHVCNARTWGVTFKVPDNPVATLIFDNVTGKFTNNDGTVRILKIPKQNLKLTKTIMLYSSVNK